MQGGGHQRGAIGRRTRTCADLSDGVSPGREESRLGRPRVRPGAAARAWPTAGGVRRHERLAQATIRLVGSQAGQAGKGQGKHHAVTAASYE